MTRDELIVRHLRKPEGYKVTDEEWQEKVERALVYGCDWLQHLQNDMGLNPLIAASVEELCERMEETEREVRDLRDIEFESQGGC